MAFTAEDRLAIHEVVSLHGHLFDNGELDRLDELFTSDIVFDASEFIGAPIPGIDDDIRVAAVAGGAVALGDRNPLGHHVTNIVVTEKTDSEAEVRSKGIGVMTDGRSVTVTYEDIVVRTPDGWRIRHRKLIPRRKPLTR
jgi:ketosteroid isomerase-like protein